MASLAEKEKGVSFRKRSASPISKASEELAQMGGVVVINLAIPDVFKITFSLL